MLAALVWLSAAGSARAETPAAEASLHARQRFDRGQVLYSLQRYHEAWLEYEAAFELSGLPALLFNIGQCHRNLGRLGPAILAFRRYLQLEPGAPDRGAVEQLVRDLDAELRVRRSAGPPGSLAPARPRATPPPALPGRLGGPTAGNRRADDDAETAGRRLDAILVVEPPPTRASRRWWLVLGGIAVATTAAVLITTYDDRDLGVVDFTR